MFERETSRACCVTCLEFRSKCLQKPDMSVIVDRDKISQGNVVGAFTFDSYQMTLKHSVKSEPLSFREFINYVGSNKPNTSVSVPTHSQYTGTVLDCMRSLVQGLRENVNRISASLHSIEICKVVRGKVVRSAYKISKSCFGFCILRGLLSNE
ncbi:hypothetical protein EMIT0373P_10505 [Pseudomonas chlororaphis]